MLKVLTFIGIVYLICVLTPVGEVTLTIIDQLIVARAKNIEQKQVSPTKKYPTLEDDPWWKRLVN